MSEIKLKEDIIKKIYDDVFLTATIADHLSLKLRHFLIVLKGNDPRLTQASVLRILKNHFKLKNERDLLTEIETEHA